MILALVLAAAVTATFQPPTPSVGDLVTIEFAAPVQLDASPQYEVVSSQGNRVVVRTFTPQPFALSGTTGGVRFRNLTVPVRSVLKPNDDLTAAPLVPPREIAYPRAPWIAIAAAALLAALAWIAVWWRARKRVEEVIPSLPADVQFRQAVARAKNHPQRWALLADATRTFLVATRPGLSSDLTTREFLRRCDDPVVADILRQGDLEKFSPWGAAPMDFEVIASRALALVPEPVAEEKAA
jgi:hypothetical protein